MKRSSKKIGAPPGTLVYIGNDKTEPIKIDVFNYDSQSIEIVAEADLSQLAKCRDSKTISWINVAGVHDTDAIRMIGELFGIHSLTLEDVVNTSQRPKMEEFDNYIYIVVRMLSYNHLKRAIDTEQVSIIVGSGWVITFQERIGDVFDAVRQHLKGGGKIRSMGAGYLAYSLMDAIVDQYFVILEHAGEDIEGLEAYSLDGELGNGISRKIYRQKRALILLRKSIWPLRELIGSIERSTTDIFGKSMYIYLRDLYDHTIQIIDTIESYRDMISGVRDTYMTALSNRMNNIMKVLTVIATIFIPLTFIAGIYGMNFEYMPELKWRFGYPLTLGIMALISVVMIFFFRKKRWL